MHNQRPHKRNVILGAGGFIGINLAKMLAEDACDLVCFDRIANPHWPTRAKTIIGDFPGMPDALLDTLDDAVVYHLISSGRPNQRSDTAATEITDDVVTTLRYLECTKGRNLRWIFLSSGGTVYGTAEACPIVESARTEPICTYGIVKLTLERYFSLYRKLHGTDYVVARVANPYGAWQDPLRGQGVIAALIYKASARQAIEIWGDGENIRDYLHVTDVVRAVVALSLQGESGEIYNVGSGQGASINQLITTIENIIGIKPDLKYVEARATDVRRNVLDIGKILKQTDWRPEIALQEGIYATSQWITQHCLHAADPSLRRNP